MSEEKTQTQELREKLMNEPKGAKSLSSGEITAADDFCEGYKAFVNASPIEREAVVYTLEAAKKAGFTEFNPEKSYQAGDKVYLVNRGKAIALAVIGKNGATCDFTVSRLFTGVKVKTDTVTLSVTGKPNGAPLTGGGNGDLNFDGKITAADARIALRLAVGLESGDATVRARADVDCDGRVSAADARAILRAAVGL